MTDPDLGRLTFASVLGREPTDREPAHPLGTYLDGLGDHVAHSPGYRLMPGVSELLVQAGVSAAARRPKRTSGCHVKGQ